MKDRTAEQLRALDDDALFRYFTVKARFSNQMPARAQYFIRFRGISICESDTQKLWVEFRKEVRSGR